MTPSIDGAHLLPPRWPDRAILLDQRFPDGAPSDVVVLDVPAGQFVLCCPLTGVVLTSRMAEAAGLTNQALTHMLTREAPLGLDPQGWTWVRTKVAQAIERTGPHVPALIEGQLAMAVGGSAVACFSSTQTALGKKQFPQDELHLARILRDSPLLVGASDAEFAAALGRATTVYRDLQLSTPPLAPWFGILARLEVEGTPDVDIQVRSTVIDSTLSHRSLQDVNVLIRRDADRLGRWSHQDVYAAFPVLRQLHDDLAHRHVELEFLGPQAGNIAERTDWWQLHESSPRRPRPGALDAAWWRRQAPPRPPALGRGPTPRHAGESPNTLGRHQG